jgi:hypothetical protein
MAQFSGNAQRLDPYKNFQISAVGWRPYVLWQQVYGRFPPRDVIAYREGSDSSGSRKSVAGMKGDATAGYQKANLSFSEWASKVWNFGWGDGAQTPAQTPSTPHRKRHSRGALPRDRTATGRLQNRCCWVFELQAASRPSPALPPQARTRKYSGTTGRHF